MSLTPTQQDNLRQKLELIKLRIQAELSQHDPDQLQTKTGTGAGSQGLDHDALSQYLHQHAEWQALQRALARLNENIADMCSECGATIPYARLEVEPTAERCIACQSAREAEGQRLHLHSAW